VRSFLDTNILVYADAGDEPIKQHRSVRKIGSDAVPGCNTSQAILRTLQASSSLPA
jgi:predicted nucleic acid-binding protein